MIVFWNGEVRHSLLDHQYVLYISLTYKEINDHLFLHLVDFHVLVHLLNAIFYVIHTYRIFLAELFQIGKVEAVVFLDHAWKVKFEYLFKHIHFQFVTFLICCGDQLVLLLLGLTPA